MSSREAKPFNPDDNMLARLGHLVLRVQATADELKRVRAENMALRTSLGMAFAGMGYPEAGAIIAERDRQQRIQARVDIINEGIDRDVKAIIGGPVEGE